MSGKLTEPSGAPLLTVTVGRLREVHLSAAARRARCGLPDPGLAAGAWQR